MNPHLEKAGGRHDDAVRELRVQAGRRDQRGEVAVDAHREHSRRQPRPVRKQQDPFPLL